MKTIATLRANVATILGEKFEYLTSEAAETKFTREAGGLIGPHLGQPLGPEVKAQGKIARRIGNLVLVRGSNGMTLVEIEGTETEYNAIAAAR